MRFDTRLVAAAAALAAIGAALWGDWWTVSWADGLAGAGAQGIGGSGGTGGLAALLPAVVLAVVLTTLTLGATGRRVVGVVGLLAGLGMAALGFAGADPADVVVEQHVALAALGADWTLARTAVPATYGVLGLLVAGASALWVARPPARRVRTVAAASGDVTDPVASWKAMDAGHDPTDEGDRA